MKAAVAVAHWLAAKRFEYCFELAGGMIAHLLDALAEVGYTNIVSMHHEQAAGFAAEGFMRSTRGRRMAVAMGTSGPGATNLVTPIGSCWFDSVPCLFVTGQVNTHEQKGDRPLRQQGFQELDVVALVRSITKYAARVESATMLLPMLHEACSAALSGRRGPVLVDIPNDIQRAEIPDEVVEEWVKRPLHVAKGPAVPDAALSQLLNLCRESTRPLVCFGGGAKTSSSFDDWRERLERAGVPYVATLLGQERIPASPHYFQMIGAYGNRIANWAIQHCDLLIAVGARLDIRQTGADTKDFARSARVVQVDIDKGQLNNRVPSHLAIECDAESFFTALPVSGATFPMRSPAWVAELTSLRTTLERDEYPDPAVSPYRIMQELMSAAGGEPAHFVCDVGNHQMWAAHGLKLRPGQSIHHCGGMGAMGFALPAGIGIGLATGQRVYVIVGDGGFQLNMQELDTLRRLKLNVVIILLNNESLGMVKNFQDMYFDGRDQSTRRGYSFPDFVKVVTAFGITAVSLKPGDSISAAIRSFEREATPALVEIGMPGATECRPRLAFGAKLDEQYPMIGSA